MKLIKKERKEEKVRVARKGSAAGMGKARVGHDEPHCPATDLKMESWDSPQ